MSRILLKLAVIAGGLGAVAQPASAETCVSGPFMVFFDLNDSMIYPSGAAILDNVAELYANCGNRQVTVAGYDDRSGTTKHSMIMSQERADAVRAYLIARGIPKANIVTHAFGESQPLIETKDGVKEPQNRRVEINFGATTGS